MDSDSPYMCLIMVCLLTLVSVPRCPVSTAAFGHQDLCPVKLTCISLLIQFCAESALTQVHRDFPKSSLTASLHPLLLGISAAFASSQSTCFLKTPS